ncbi:MULTISPECIES: 3-oxoacid CoA-transferase subunit B [Bacillaceae]|jgi:acetate CoA/acetoacetate CoA-transferase beta subunit|uniref:3-oxoacid CoA-transferase subunit B n=1 Tax=Metabacillus hrfriensis TaxID=3048891 RepID=A0ACD4RCZ4_9BACI|nr:MULTISPECIES: 3-oxoacid CoA-transferase subunit B [Bacillaceae]UOK58464.1 3-oxoacid CoA-transferase subunit B [Bacillus sp. OVS6]USK29160.1 3-oxoacid CoA-transferase subunit B [Bacillus sp. CMF21]MDQ0861701.1 acetate CoA/acetoacetate CoA-transferase beta subunit [Bacillus sp. V2I10]UAL52838.1 3-oxoacid CoA-transferase subunit B [Metabacillus dongyingensis]WHZ58380.1 3-oxoacid CoA-transferase subunit B [Metabacillus sp. CT-WN-B3]
MGMGVDVRNRIAKRAAKEIHDGLIVNLGIGIPTLVADHLPQDIHVLFHAENGVLGTGPSPNPGQEDPALCNAGGFPITTVTGASYFDSATAFGMIRRGYIDITILGALEVSEKGDLANWIVPGKRVPGMGGAMELAQKAKKVIVLMNHVNKQGESKILKECTLPLTARRSVDLIITDMAVMEVKKEGLVLKEVMAPYTVDEVIANTEATLKIPAVVNSIE